MADAPSVPARRRWRGEAAGEIWPLGALTLLVVAFNPGLTLFGHMLAGYDTFVYFYPLRSYIAVALAEGRLPLWNPYLFAGTPYLANPQTAVFYPGTWLFAVMDVPRAYAVNYLGHVWLAAVSLYGLARVSFGVGRVAAILGGAAFAFSGFMNGQAGHINQLTVTAWLPAVLLALDLAMRSGRALALAALIAGLTMQILAGHPQEVYMTGVALGLLVAWRSLTDRRSASAAVMRGLRGAVTLGVAVTLAAGISAAQLFPTLELSPYSIRGGGLSYQIAAFDAVPWPLLLPALLPGYWAHLPTTEFFGHLGTASFAIAWIGLLAGAGRPALFAAVLVTLGLLLAVGDATPLFRLVFDLAPGFSSFRVPARWLMLSTLGLAILAALGTDWLVRGRLVWLGHQGRLARSGRPVSIDAPSADSRAASAWGAALAVLLQQIGVARAVLVGLGIPLALASLVVLGQPQSRWLLLAWGLIVTVTLALVGAVVVAPRQRAALVPLLLCGTLVDLWAAGATLEHRQTIPSIPYAQDRDGIAELRARMARDPAHRSLSIATTEYVVKDTADYEERFGGLSRQALQNLLFAVKWNETLWPNTPLVYRLPSADGYDGGVLPLRHFFALAQAMLGVEQARPDGVLASRLDAMPDERWLDLLGVRWVLASRAKDDTRGAIYFDRGVTRTLRTGEHIELAALPLGEFTRLGMISSIGGDVTDGQQVATLRLATRAGDLTELPIRVGRETAPAEWAAERAPDLERVGRWSARAPDAPADWLAEIAFARQPVERLAIVVTAPSVVLRVQALNLIDDGRQMAFPVTPDSRVERVDLFDLKLYDRQDALPRAYVVADARVLDDAAAGTRLAAADFNPRAEVVLAPSPTVSNGLPASARGTAPAGVVAFERDEAEHVRLTVELPADGWLVLSDSWYPGWRAAIDGQAVAIERANLLFRAVRVPAGRHIVELRYGPEPFRRGVLVSLTTAALTVLVLVGRGVWRRRRSRRGL